MSVLETRGRQTATCVIRQHSVSDYACFIPTFFQLNCGFVFFSQPEVRTALGLAGRIQNQNLIRCSYPSLLSFAAVPMNAEERVKAPDHNLGRDILLGSAAASIATCFSNPIEVCKTRMQLQGELQTRSAELRTRRYKNMFDCFYKIARDEGIRGLQGGLGAGIMFQAVMNGFRLGCYDFINNHFLEKRPGDSGSYEFFRTAAVAASVGATGAFLANPFFLVKVRMQTMVRNPTPSAPPAAAPMSVPLQGPAVAGAAVTAPAATATASSAGAAAAEAAKLVAPNKPIGVQYNYTSTYDAFRSIIRSDGLSGLMRGAGVASVRVAMGSSVQFSTYDKSKEVIAKHFGLSGPPLHFAASSLAAVAVTVAMNPFDVIVTRLYNQNKTTGLYSSAFDVVRKMVATEGVRGLYKGLLPHYARLGPHMIVLFVAWEQLKALVRRHETSTEAI